VLCWLASAAFIVSGLAFSLWSASRGLVEWTEVWLPSSIFAVGTLPLALIALVWRWHRRKKEAELGEYERMLAQLYQD
jgi:hypothetical protein